MRPWDSAFRRRRINQVAEQTAKAAAIESIDGVVAGRHFLVFAGCHDAVDDALVLVRS